VPLGDNLTVTGLQILRMEGNMAEVGGVLVGSPADIDGDIAEIRCTQKLPSPPLPSPPLSSPVISYHLQSAKP
jgi:hypothetical protein